MHSLELALPDNIRVTYIINILRIKLYIEGLLGQADLNINIRANEGIVVTKINNFVE